MVRNPSTLRNTVELFEHHNTIMSAAETLTVLLADDDALRRDGLAAVLESAPDITVVSRCQDGAEALQQIREQRPRVAVVDMNLPLVHGIELVRRVRAEGTGTKLIILAGTTDDEIVREVVRAGADGYLLKNGPARHLVDAIRYVCDGGQYFSPQLGRDGRDRHLLEEPVRTPPAAPQETETRSGEESRSPRGTDGSDWPDYDDRPRRREASKSHPRREPTSLRDRLREESGNPDDRDYKIMSMMAEGLKPILDRLEEIDDRVGQMEEGDADLPADPRGWLSSQLAATFRGGKKELPSSGRAARDLEARMPELIEQAVTERFRQMAGKLQSEIEETHVKTLETFVKNVQVKLVQRVSSLEQDMSRHTQAMLQLRDSSQRTEENLNRLITGVDKLAQELPRRIAAASAGVETGTPGDDDEREPNRGTPRGNPTEPSGRREHREQKVKGKKLVAWGIWSLVALAVFAGLVRLILDLAGAPSDFSLFGRPTTTAVASGAPGAAPPPAKVTIAPGASSKARLEAASQAADNKDYATAEQILKDLVQAEPNNPDALKALASALYRQDKIAESTAILDKIPK